MSDNLLKEKDNNEIYENFETDDIKEEELKKKKAKSKLFKPLIIFIACLLIIAGFIYFKYFHNVSNSLNLKLLQEYNELGKKDENLRVFLSTEFCLERRGRKFLNGESILHFNKDDIDINRLLRALKILIENHPVYQSYFIKKNGKFYIKFDKTLYPEIIQKTIKESDYKNYIQEIEREIDFPLNELMTKFYIIQTEKSLYIVFFKHHSITDKMSADVFINSLNKAYMNDTIPFKSEDLYYASLYEYNLKIRNDKKYINEVKNYFFNNYDLGRTFKGYHIDKDIKYPLESKLLFFGDISSKNLRDKIYSIFKGKFSKISMFNMICQLYTLYLYNNMEDPIPELVYLRHGRNLKYFRNSMGSFIQYAYINYDFEKNSIKIGNKNYINVQKLYDNAKKQFDEQKFISRYINTFEDYDAINSFDNLIYTQAYQIDEVDDNLLPKLLPKYMLGKKLLDDSISGMISSGGNNVEHILRLLMESIYTPKGIINHLGVFADSYKLESLKKISDLFYKVADTLSDGFLSDDKLIEIKMLS